MGVGIVILAIVVIITVIYFVSPNTFQSGYSQLQNIFSKCNITLPIIPLYNGTLFTNKTINNTCIPSCIGKCGGVSDGCSGTCNAVCVVNYLDLNSYLNANINVKNYINTLSSQMQSDINLEYNLIKNGNGDTSKPEAEKIALSIWIDNNNLVPWKLNSYSQTDLGYIFTSGTINNIVTDCDPLYTYNYVKGDLKSTQLDTASAIIDTLRRFTHAEGSTPPTGSTGCLKLVLSGNSVDGCHAASQMMSDMITALNIPAYYRYNPIDSNWYIAGHGELIIPNIGYIPHGDNIYGNTIKGKIPSKDLIIPWNVLQNQIIPQQTSSNYKLATGENPAEQRYMFNLQVEYPWDGQNPGGGITSMCYCDCLNYAHEVGDGVATNQEIINLAASAHCNNCSWETC